jgi:hypothetical protein
MDYLDFDDHLEQQSQGGNETFYGISDCTTVHGPSYSLGDTIPKTESEETVEAITQLKESSGFMIDDALMGISQYGNSQGQNYLQAQNPQPVLSLSSSITSTPPKNTALSSSAQMYVHNNLYLNENLDLVLAMKKELLMFGDNVSSTSLSVKTEGSDFEVQNDSFGLSSPLETFEYNIQPQQLLSSTASSSEPSRNVSPNPKKRSSSLVAKSRSSLDSRLSIVRLGEILKTSSQEETMKVEKFILDVFSKDLNFPLGYKTWIRDTSEEFREQLLDQLFERVNPKYPSLTRQLLETVVKRATYSKMQGRLRKERRAANKKSKKAGAMSNRL